MTRNRLPRRLTATRRLTGMAAVREADIRQLDRINATMPAEMRELHRGAWPTHAQLDPNAPERVWRSQRFFAQMFVVDGAVRLSVCRTTLDAAGDRWLDGITWDELQRVKTECGFGDRWAVEIYPPTASLVDVAKIRHLWLLAEAPPFAWKKSC